MKLSAMTKVFFVITVIFFGTFFITKTSYATSSDQEKWSQNETKIILEKVSSAAQKTFLIIETVIVDYIATYKKAIVTLQKAGNYVGEMHVATIYHALKVGEYAGNKYISGIYNTASVSSAVGDIYMRAIYSISNLFNRTGEVYTSGIYLVADKITDIGSDDFYARQFAGYDNSKNSVVTNQITNNVENKIEKKTVIVNGITEDYLERRLVSFQKSLKIPDAVQIRTRDTNGSNISVDRIYDSIGESSSDAAENAVTGGSLSFSGINGTFTGDVTVGGALSANSLSASTLTISATSTFNGATNIAGPLLANNDAGTNGYILQTTGTGVQWVATSSLGISSGGGTWGSITGTLADQTDLQSALDAKQNSFATGTTAQYFRGDLTLGTFPTTTSAFTNDSGFLTSYTETDPTFTASDVAGVVTADISNWNTAFGWGDHAGAGYVTGTPWTSEGYLTSISGLNISDLTNDSGYVTGLNWNQIGGTQSDVNLSGFTNDSGFVSNLSSFTTDDLTQGSTNKYSQWVTNGSDVYYNTGDIGIGTTDPIDLFELYSSLNQMSSMTVTTPGTLSNQHAGLKFITLDNNSALGASGNKGWVMFGRGNAWGTAAQQNDFGLSYWSGSAWIDPLWIDSGTGYVGVGTSEPGAPFAVTTANNYGTVLLTGSGAEANLALKSTSTGGRNYQLVSGGSGGTFSGGKFGLYDATAGAARLAVDSSGNVGIGTTNPGSLLEISLSQNTPTATNIVNSNAGVNARSDLRFSNGTGIGYVFYTGANNTAFGGASSLNLYNSANSSITLSTNATERMRITNAGNVGIGTTAPDQLFVLSKASASPTLKLERTGTGAKNWFFTNGASATGAFSISDETDYRFNISSTGNVGIGITSPTSPLHISTTNATPMNIVSSATNTFLLRSTLGGNAATAQVQFQTVNRSIMFASTDQASGVAGFYDATASAWRMAIIHSSGNIDIGGGIATSYKLNVAGTTAGNQFLSDVGSVGAPAYTFKTDTNTGLYSGGADNLRLSTAGTDRLIIDSSGQVGIGTSPQGTSFHVRGTTAANNYTQIWGASGASGSLSTLALIKTADASGDFVFSTFLAGGSVSAAPKIHFGGYNATPVNGAMFTMDIANGRFGVGLTAPTYKMQVYDSTNTDVGFRIGSVSDTYSPRIILSKGSTEYGDMRIYSNGTLALRNLVSNKDLVAGVNVGGVDTQVLTIQGTTGYVGIGTSTPSGTFEVYKNTDGLNGLYLTNPNTGSGARSKIFLTVGSALSATITSGTAAAPSLGLVADANNTGYAGIWTVTSGVYNERFRINNDGKVGIGTTAPQAMLHVVRADDGAPVRFEDSNGYCEIDPTSTAWSCTSDIRLKENIASLTQADSLAGILELNPVSFEWKTDESNAQRIGLIAQEVEKIFPDLVNTDKQTGFKSVSYGSFTTYIIGAIQELNLKIENVFVSLVNQVVEVRELIAGKLKINGDVCVDDVCVTKEQFKEMLRKGGGTATVIEIVDDGTGGTGITTDGTIGDTATTTDDGTGGTGTSTDGGTGGGGGTSTPDPVIEPAPEPIIPPTEIIPPPESVPAPVDEPAPVETTPEPATPEPAPAESSPSEPASDPAPAESGEGEAVI